MDSMSFEADIMIPEKGIDDFGQQAKARITSLRYSKATSNRRFAKMNGIFDVRSKRPRPGKRFPPYDSGRTALPSRAAVYNATIVATLARLSVSEITGGVPSRIHASIPATWSA